MKKNSPASGMPRNQSLFLTVLLIMVLMALFVTAASAQVTLIQLSTDTFTNSGSQHMTEVEPDTFAFGSTVVSAFQVGRIFDGGSSDIGFATSTDGGNTWTNGFLPGITVNFMGGHFSAASDPSVAYDAAHGLWMIASLGLSSNNSLLVSSSSDGINWNNPVTVDNRSSFADKEWIVCDSNSGSPFYGHCYVEWDDAGLGDQVKMSMSSDGGQTWSGAIKVSSAGGLGGQPVVQPNGTVVVPFEGFSGIQSFTSTDGGLTWSRPVTVANISEHGVAGSMRTSPLPSAEVDAAGTVYVAWQDCRFRSGCSSNDIVLSTSTDGTTWSAVTRVPIDQTTSTVDHFIPGLAVDPTTSGATAHLGLTYYFFPQSNCGSRCQLAVGFVSSTNGGKTWTRPLRLAGPMKTTWVANTNQGRMVGDYISTSYVNGSISFGVFAKALAPTGGTTCDSGAAVCNEAMYTEASGLSLDQLAGPGVLSSAGDRAIPGAHSDHGPSLYWDHEGRLPKNPQTPPLDID